MNRVMMIGRLTKDIDLRKVGQDQKSVCKFVLAVPRRKKDQSDFISSTAWGKTAELMNEYLKKGDRIAATGRIETDVYEKDGQKVYTTNFVVEDFEFLEKKREAKTEEQEFKNADEEELPFVF